MNDHYYSSKPVSKSDVREVQAELRGQSFLFLTDHGVFSKKGVDFGSRLLIETVSLHNEKSILDLGCGYGPIGISIAKTHPNVTVVMVDVNERAVELSQKNAKRNQVDHQIESFVSDGFAKISDRKFDAILFNPPIRIGKSKIYSLFVEAKQHLNANGSLWIVIRKQQGAKSAKAELEQLFPTVELVTQKKSYCIIRAMVH
jgi:16S rRNA (guanine1207-N2)-methyltransferase